jgi:hypothetical protein
MNIPAASAANASNEEKIELDRAGLKRGNCEAGLSWKDNKLIGPLDSYGA